MIKDWNRFLLPYQLAVNELIIQLQNIKKQFQTFHKNDPIESINGRVKPIDSIKEKMKRRYIDPKRLSQDMEDIAGLRIICPFLEDIYEVVNILRNRSDMNIIEERDYVKNVKNSGYRSYHIIFEYSVQMIDGIHKILAEIQIRTLAMNFWSTLDHSLHYKHGNSFPDELEDELKRSAKTTFKLDQNMSNIRKKLQQSKRISHNKNGSDKK